MQILWQGLQSADGTIDENVECDVEEIRQLIDNFDSSNSSDNTTSVPLEVE